MTENMAVRSQLEVNFNVDVAIWLKCASGLHLPVAISNIYATGGSRYKLDRLKTFSIDLH